MVLISSCLLGVRCRYDAKAVEPHPEALRIFKQGSALVLCPEMLGGLSCPRDPAEIQSDGRIMTESGEDVTEEFLFGAKKVLEVCLSLGVKKAYLKERSPSCGSSKVYDGTFSRTLIPGWGVCAALLREHGIEVAGEDELDHIYAEKQKK
ncbi:DUF523 domain-containing protein [Clostridia bacterium]|nr:DUF523 domain-containing protein [Clostridia bacterium]